MLGSAASFWDGQVRPVGRAVYGVPSNGCATLLGRDQPATSCATGLVDVYVFDAGISDWQWTPTPDGFGRSSNSRWSWIAIPP